MDADFTNGSSSSRNSRQENYRLTNPNGADSNGYGSPALTGVDTGSHATLGRTALDQPEQPVQWSSPMTRRTAESDPPQRRSVQDFASTPRLSTPEVDTPTRRSVQDFDAAPNFTADFPPATNGHAITEADSRRASQDLESSRRAAQDLEASLRRAAELEAAVRRAAAESDSAPQALAEPEPGSRRAIPEPELASWRATPEPELASWRAIPEPEPASRRTAPEPDLPSRRAAPEPDLPSRRAAPEPELASQHSAADAGTSHRAVAEVDAPARRAAPEVNTPAGHAAPESNGISRRAERSNVSSGRRAAPEPELPQPVPNADGERARQFRAEDAPNIDLHHIMGLLVASHDLEVAAQAAESGAGSVADLAEAARRTRTAAVDLVAAWYGGPDHMRRFGEVLLQAAAETA
ncbi:hypothetical protein [Nocardia sp. NPDC056100]|uniref:hypothetical protein n=1 Tax=Nocardia sp. NPDC056100 TaxID=3345712 RepID=UPI0035D8092B